MASSGEFGQSAPVSSTISFAASLLCQYLNTWAVNMSRSPQTHCPLSLLEMDSIFQYISRSKQDAPYGVSDATVVSKIAGQPYHVMFRIQRLKLPRTGGYFTYRTSELRPDIKIDPENTFVCFMRCQILIRALTHMVYKGT